MANHSDNRSEYPDLGTILDGTYNLKSGLGRGGFAKVYYSDVDLDNFDYASVAAFREKRTGRTAEDLPESRAQHFEKVETRAKFLRSPIFAQKVRSHVEIYPNLYPSTGQCAVKILDMIPGLSHDQLRDIIFRFEGEWKNLMGITHENVMSVFGGNQVSLEDRKIWYYAMEYLQGIVSSKKRSDFPIEKQLEIISQAARGLGALHHYGIIHRDVKPDNILVTLDPFKVKVSDIGIAKDVFKKTELTMSGNVMGTVNYMSPEQATDSKSVDERSDVYSLGASLYNSLTGKKPYQDMNLINIIHALHSKTKPASIHELRGDVPGNIIDVVEKMMDPDASRRHDSMEEVRDDLEALLDGRSTSIERKNRLRKIRINRPVPRENGNKPNLKKWGVAGTLAALVTGSVLMFGRGGKGGEGDYENGSRNYNSTSSESNTIENVRTQLSHLEGKVAALPKECVLYLPFDSLAFKLEGNRMVAKDMSGKGNHCKVFAQQETGISGEALGFNGKSNYVFVANSLELNNEEFTWALWIKRNELVNNKNNISLISNGPGLNTDGTYGLQITKGSNPNKLQFGIQGTNESTTSNGSLFDESWHHVAITKERSDLTSIYIDGNLDSHKMIPKGTKYGGTMIGGGHGDYIDAFSGTLDEVMIFKRALSRKEIQELYNLAKK